MAYNHTLADRVRTVFHGQPDVEEKKMFGGVAFMVGGHMCVGITGDDLMARVGPERYAEALSTPNAREMDFTGRTMKGFVFVSKDGTASDEQLANWISICRSFVDSLPRKK